MHQKVCNGGWGRGLEGVDEGTQGGYLMLLRQLQRPFLLISQHLGHMIGNLLHRLCIKWASGMMGQNTCDTTSNHARIELQSSCTVGGLGLVSRLNCGFLTYLFFRKNQARVAVACIFIFLIAIGYSDFQKLDCG